ncbi:MAG: TadE family protein [Actinomycetota bacterium]
MAPPPTIGAPRGACTATRHERGAAILELAFVFVPLILIAVITVELGLMWKQQLDVDQSARAGARAAAALTNDPEADREALRSLVGSLSPEALANVDAVVIYQAPASGDMPGICAISSTSMCNRYPASVLADLDDDSRWGCGGAAHDRFWCPTARDPQLHAPVEAGVRIEFRHDWRLGMFPDGVDLSATTVMRLDPLIR